MPIIKTETGFIEMEIFENFIGPGVHVREQETQVIKMLELRRAFQALPNKHRVVIGLLIAGFTQQDIANILGVSRTSVGSIKKQATFILRNELQDRMIVE
jgi:DNA-directed RNA polymerase specialized sigma24 family protein